MNGPLTVASPEGGPGPAAPGSDVPSADEVRAELDALEDALGLDIADVLARAVELEQAAESGGEAVLHMRARLLRADVWQRLGQTAAASRLLREVEAWASEHDSEVLQARVDRLLARIFYALGDVAACLEHAVLALQRLDADAPARTRSASLMALAGALNATGSYDAARERYQQAECFAIAGADVARQLAVLNNEAYSELEAGDPEQAWKVVERLQAVAAEHRCDLNPNYLDTVAQAQLALGRCADAERTTQASIEAISGAWEQEVDSLAQFLTTLAIAQRRLGKIEAAQATLDRCRVLCEVRELATIGVQVIQEQAELYAAAGDFRHAFAEYKAFHIAHHQLISQQGEARARTRQAMFETAEARENAARFHDQARRDPLTGLPNRRYIDEMVPAMLLESARTGEPLVVGFVDADHFKRVNDTCSHQVGDQVLVAIAGLLAAAVPTGPGTGFAARAGGEEFLLVLAGLDVPAAVRHLETFRLAVAGYPWQPVTGDLPVTVSIGVAASGANSTQAELFARADEVLYAAKRDGRNRVYLAH